MDTLEVLRKARTRYAANPSHAPLGQIPTHGDVCAVMAFDVYRTDGRTRGTLALARVAGLNCANADRANAEVIAWNAANDTATVLAAFDRAILNEEAEAAEHREAAPHSLLAIAEHDHELVAA